MVNFRHGANRAPFREGLIRDIHHQGESLDGKLAQADEETLLSSVDVDLDGEE